MCIKIRNLIDVSILNHRFLKETQFGGVFVDASVLPSCPRVSWFKLLTKSFPKGVRVEFRAVMATKGNGHTRNGVEPVVTMGKLRIACWRER